MSAKAWYVNFLKATMISLSQLKQHNIQVFYEKKRNDLKNPSLKCIYIKVAQTSFNTFKGPCY